MHLIPCESGEKLDIYFLVLLRCSLSPGEYCLISPPISAKNMWFLGIFGLQVFSFLFHLHFLVLAGHCWYGVSEHLWGREFFWPPQWLETGHRQHVLWGKRFIYWDSTQIEAPLISCISIPNLIKKKEKKKLHWKLHLSAIWETLKPFLMCAQELLALGEQIGDVKTGLSREAILKKLKTRTSTTSSSSKALSDHLSENGTCIICQVHAIDEAFYSMPLIFFI